MSRLDAEYLDMVIHMYGRIPTNTRRVRISQLLELWGYDWLYYYDAAKRLARRNAQL